MSTTKATPLPRVSGDELACVDCNGCIAGGKVYRTELDYDCEDACEGCAFANDAGKRYCRALACTQGARDDSRSVIFIEHTNPYTGHDVGHHSKDILITEYIS